jgi:ADP-ribose pyrophosphatase YjhB (NUDIX family)
VVLVLEKNEASQKLYLCQQRLKNPYYGFWGRLGGKVRWGESFEEAASRELEEETGLIGSFETKLFFRKRDYHATTKELLEDKLFVVMRALTFSGELVESFEGGRNAWMTQEELASQPKHFPSAIEFIDLIDHGTPYAHKEYFYNEDEY